MKLFLLLVVLAIVVCISLLIDAQQPHSTQKAAAFKNCKATECDNSQQVCAHYTCTTPEDAARINENNINLTCGADNVLKCTTKGTTTYCGCAPKN